MIGAEVFRIHIEAKKCCEDGVCEAELNDHVHGLLLDAIIT